MNKISLTASMRSNLLSLQQTGSLMSTTQERLSTGDRMYENIEALEDVSDLKFNTLMFPEKTVSVEDVDNAFATLNATSFQNQYNEVLAQYNSLVKDASSLWLPKPAKLC